MSGIKHQSHTQAALAALALIAVLGMIALPVAARPPAWKGAETFSLLAAGPAPERCGPAPRFLEARFAGSGIDTAGGTFAVTASGCRDTVEQMLFDMEATDTFADGALHIAPDDVALVIDPATCVATNAHPVAFTVAGGTGRFAGATGRGTFDLAMTEPGCGAAPQPVHVWFSGRLQLPR